jgi:signal transduction histidine kinase
MTNGAKKVLVIDDSRDIRDLVVAALDAHGFQVLSAEDGQSGIELARKQPPDLILCDVRMPGMDGYGVLSTLRNDSVAGTIPFIFLTGEVDKSQVRQGMELGADDYLTKPFTFDELIGSVNTRLKKQEAVLQRSEKKLEDLRGNLSLALPHELLTPLHGILGLSSLMIDDHAKVKPAEILDFARNIHDSGLRLNHLIENFLTYSRIELLAADPQKVAAFRTEPPAPTARLVEETVQRLAAKYRRQEDVAIEVEEASLPIQPDNFRKIVEELVDNAIKFSKAGSPVIVNGRIQLDSYILTISDRGRGLAPEQIARIGPHMQFDRKYYEQQGSGLGLIIAKRLTELYGGYFSIESTQGEFARVEIRFKLPVNGAVSH